MYDETAIIVGLYTGQVFLRYPAHHEQKSEIKHECGKVCLGWENFKQHARSCEDDNAEWLSNYDASKSSKQKGDDRFEFIERDGVHIESVSWTPIQGY